MIEIELPDGSILEFPDGTPDDVISNVAADESDKLAFAQREELRRNNPNIDEMNLSLIPGIIPISQRDKVSQKNIGNIDPTDPNLSLVEKSKAMTNLLKGDAGRDARDFMTGVESGVTLNLRDELGGIANAVGGGTFSEGRAEAQEELARAKDRSPILTGTGEFAGSLVTGGAALKGATTLPRIIGQSAALGAAQGAGSSEADTVGGYIKDTLQGGAVGAAIPIAGKGLKELTKLSGKIVSEGSKKAGNLLFGEDIPVSASSAAFNQAKKESMKNVKKANPELYNKIQNRLTDEWKDGLNTQNSGIKKGLVEKYLAGDLSDPLALIPTLSGAFSTGGATFVVPAMSSVWRAVSPRTHMNVVKPLIQAINKSGKWSTKKSEKIGDFVQGKILPDISDKYKSILKEAFKTGGIVGLSQAHYALLSADRKYRTEADKLAKQSNKTSLGNDIN